MERGKDFIYEYSDLNYLHIRSKVLTGDYKGLIVDFGSSYILQESNVAETKFNFNYILYELPEKKDHLNKDGLELFLSELLINIINDRTKDPDHKQKLDDAAEQRNLSNIKIDKKYYQQVTERL